MRKTRIVTLIAATITSALLASATAVQAAPPDEQVVKSLVVTQDGKSIGSANPRVPQTLTVSVAPGDRQLEALVQLRGSPSTRVFLMTQLEPAIMWWAPLSRVAETSSLEGASQGQVSASSLQGGWELSFNSADDVLVTLSGSLPSGVRAADLLEVVVRTDNRVQAEVRVEATVRDPLIPTANWPLILAGAIGAIAIIGLALLWMRSRSSAPRQQWQI